MTQRSGRRALERETAWTPDPELMQQLAKGQLGALGALYDRYQAPLRSFIGRATRDAHDVDDLLHATFLAAAKSAARYDGRSCCRPWLIGVAAQLLRQRRRAFGRFGELLAVLKGAALPLTDPGSQLQARGDVERALARLSDAKRITLLMAEVEGLSCDEIADALSIPVGTVWTRLHAARRELRQVLGSGKDVP
jgi:RNA polymerase sigma factor (sigma-70 family)